MVKRAAEEVGSAAARRHGDKMTKYFHDCDREGIKFFPVVVEVLGGWHEDAACVITRQLAATLARRLTSRSNTCSRGWVFS